MNVPSELSPTFFSFSSPYKNELLCLVSIEVFSFLDFFIKKKGSFYF